MSHMTLVEEKVREFSRCTKYDGVRSVQVTVAGVIEEVFIDPERGPRIVNIDGTLGAQVNRIPIANPAPVIGSDTSGHHGLRKPWSQHTSTEQEVLVLQAAKINRSRKARFE
mmetsp:Transcript_20640/g.58542  ORF Transcript_20640/g.58542 Transcript_20640/m.58542 type:complete len:112 (-) Transcript_20640:63-398(-)